MHGEKDFAVYRKPLITTTFFYGFEQYSFKPPKATAFVNNQQPSRKKWKRFYAPVKHLITTTYLNNYNP